MKLKDELQKHFPNAEFCIRDSDNHKSASLDSGHFRIRISHWVLSYESTVSLHLSRDEINVLLYFSSKPLNQSLSELRTLLDALATDINLIL